jgi:hypothetical protein
MWYLPLLCDYKTLRLNGRQKRKCLEFEERSYEKKPDLIIHKIQNTGSEIKVV